MRENVIFEMTKEHLQTGLRKIPVGYSSTAYVDPKKGLTYCGKPLFELVVKNPLEVIYLLLYGRESSESELLCFTSEIENRSALSKEFIDALAKMPKTIDPLTSLSCALQLLGSMEKKEDMQEDCLNLIAKLPLLVATLIQLHEGKEMVSAQKDLGFLENFLETLSLPSSQKQNFSKLFFLLQILFMDEEAGSVDAFVGKTVASAHVDLYKSLSAAMIAFSGNLTSFASLKSLELLLQIEEETQGVATKEEVERILKAKLQKKELLYGFGHPSFRFEDTRASLLYQFARNHYPDHPLIKIALLLRYEAPRILSEFYPHIVNPFPNVYAIASPLLQAAGFTCTQYYPLLFALARSVGIAIQILHESKNLILVHPHYFYRLR
jgi:citrate synthase